eukprot:1267360-Pyramimonas_sp.AAC.1
MAYGPYHFAPCQKSPFILGSELHALDLAEEVMVMNGKIAIPTHLRKFLNQVSGDHDVKTSEAAR